MSEGLITFNQEEHWCKWCRDHDRDYDPSFSAVTDCYFLSTGPRDYAMIYGQPGGPAMHLHDVVLTDQAELTVRASVKRLVKPQVWWLKQHRKDIVWVGLSLAAIAAGARRG